MSECYKIYGVWVKSPFPLSAQKGRGRLEIEILEEKNGFFETKRCLAPSGFKRSAEPFSYATLPDGSEYIRFFDLFHFWVSSDGKKIICQSLKKSHSAESSLNFLQANVLSFAFLKWGLEPLHATAVVMQGKAIAFLGEGGYGKSTLAASFLARGFSLLTDDLLLLRKRGFSFYAAPGAPRIKLLNDSAKNILKETFKGFPMNPSAEKRVFPLSGDQMCKKSHPVKALFVIRPANGKQTERRTTIRKLKGKNAALGLLQGAYNLVIQTPERLRHQFLAATDFAREIPVYSLSYTRDLNYLPEVREGIFRCLRREKVLEN